MSESYASTLRQRYAEVRRRLGMQSPPVAIVKPIATAVAEAKEAMPPPALEVERRVVPENATISVREIIAAAAHAAKTTPDDIRGPRRRSELVGWRQVAMYLAVTLRPDLSFPSIGRAFDRNHSTVIHAYEKISDDLQRWTPMITAILDGLPADDA